MLGLMTCLIIYSTAALAFSLLAGLMGPERAPKARAIISTCAIAAAIIAFSFAAINAKIIRYKTYDITVSKASPISSLKIAMASDLHLGRINGAKWLDGFVEKINALDADVVVIVGDIMDGDYYALKDPGRMAEALRGIKSRHGVYGVLGNHDAGRSFADINGFLDASNIQILLDETIVVEDKFVLSGRRDIRPIGTGGQARTALEPYSPSESSLPIIVLDHQPSGLEDYAPPTDLLLSGHTHRGQIFPFNFITAGIYTVDYGYYKADNALQVVVSSGAATWGPPLRSGSSCEIVVINMAIEPASE
jgi:predicted MPP superfamily phosphohydrolase